MHADADLLRRYAEASSDAAFTEFVSRHVDMVYYAALRQLGGDAHRAKDVTQLVFTDLARKAGAVCRHPAITSWLHKSTRFATAKVRRAEQTRQKYEWEAATMNTLQTDHEAPAKWERLGPLIDDALHELKEGDREAVLLRFFERRSFGEIGAVLALSENAAHMRVERALDKLHAALARRGVDSTVAALSTVLAGEAVASAPVGLAASVATGALGAAAAGTGFLGLLWFFISTKVGLPLGAAVVLAGTVAIYQNTQANAAAAEAFANARQDYATLAARLAGLDASVAAAEQSRSDREAALRRATAAAAATRQTAEDAERAKQQQALQQFLQSDPELRRLRLELVRGAIKAELSLGPQKLTREELEQQANILAERPDVQRQELSGRVNNGPGGIRLTPGWDASLIIRELSNALFYTDDGFSKEQVTQFETILTAAKTSSSADLSRYGVFDWDRVLREAELILSPTQLQGLRSIAARGRNGQLVAAVAKESETKP